MAIRFVIKSTTAAAEKEGDAFVRFSGASEPFNRHCERSSRTIETDGKGDPIKWRFNTGMDEGQVEFFGWYNEEEKKVLAQTIKDLSPVIARYYGGPEVVSSTNYSFWKKDRNVNRLSLTHEDMDVFFDTSKPAHALLYLSIASGAFIDMVAPTKDWAERYQIPHYMALEAEVNTIGDDEEDIKRSDAHTALGDLRKNHGREALYMLAWCIQYDTNAFGAYNHSVSEKDLTNYHIKYIDGKLKTKKKKNCPKTFLDYYEKWCGQQTRPLLITEAYIKAGEYFNFVTQREKKYVTSDGTILGNTITEAFANLMKPKFNQDYEKLREQVENKWKE
jgi:hypothetical protein